MKKLSILVNNNFTNDSRLYRTISALENSFNICIFARNDMNTPEFIRNDSFRKHPLKRFRHYAFKGLPFPGMLNIILNFIIYFIVDIIIQRRIYNATISTNTDIVYANDFDTLIPGYFASRRKRAELIYDTHELWVDRIGAKDNLYRRFLRRIEYILESIFIKRCDLVITVSDGIADELVSRYAVRRPTVVRNLDIERETYGMEERINIRRSLNIPDKSKVITYHGVLADGRGIPELIDAILLLPDDYHLILMGFNISSKSLSKIDTISRIHYLGMVDENRIQYYSSAADIGIVPYHTNNIYNYFVTFPNKLSQFLNAGLAVLFYDCLEARKIFKKCKCGNILTEISPENISAQIIELAENNNISSLKENARKCFHDNYNWKIDETILKDAVIKLM